MDYPEPDPFRIKCFGSYVYAARTGPRLQAAGERERQNRFFRVAAKRIAVCTSWIRRRDRLGEVRVCSKTSPYLYYISVPQGPAGGRENLQQNGLAYVLNANAARLQPKQMKSELAAKTNLNCTNQKHLS